MKETTDKRYLRVRVRTSMKRETIALGKQDLWHIDVRGKAERGLANERVRALLANELQVDSRKLKLVKGATSTSKTFLLM